MTKSNRRPMRFLVAATLVCMGAPSLLQADPPAENTSKSESSTSESLDIRYARANLELAKLDLRRAEEWNKKIPGLFSDRTIDFMRKHVQIDAEQLDQTLASQHVDVHKIYIRGAEAAVELAEADVKRKQAILDEIPNDFNSLELKRSVAVANVAKLNLERTVAQEGSLHTLSYLQWQIEELRNQLLELQIKFEKSARR